MMEDARTSEIAHGEELGKAPRPLARSARRRAAILSRLRLYGRRPGELESNRMAKRIALIVLSYFWIGVIINRIDPEYLVAAWLCAGGLGLAFYLTRESQRSAVNVYTALFGIGTLGCLAGFALSRGWLI